MPRLQLSFSDTLPINMFPEKAVEGSRSEVFFRSVPGLRTKYTIPEAPIRGMLAIDEDLFVVAGKSLYKISIDIVTRIDAVDGKDQVDMVRGGEYFVIAADKTYVYTLASNAFTEIGQGPFSSLIYSDGRWIGSINGTDTWKVSELLDPFTWDPLAFARAEFNEDKIVRLVADSGVVWIFGEKSIELWSNAGGTPFPYVRSSVIELGCTAGRSVQKVNNSIFWLARNGRIYAAQGQSPQRISTEVVERAIAAKKSETVKSSILSDRFYVLNFDTLSISFDTLNGAFHSRQSHNTKNQLVSWQYGNSVYYHQEELLGSFETGEIAAVDESVYTENSRPLVRQIQTNELFSEQKRIRVYKLVADIESGFGGTIMLDWSSDGEKSYENELLKSMGEVGEYRRRVEFWRLGQYRRRLFRLRVSDAVPFSCYGVYIEADADT